MAIENSSLDQPSQQIDPLSLSPTVTRGLEIVGNLSLGAMGGYIFYWMTRLIQRVGLLNEPGGVHPLPYVLSGVMGAAIVETERLTHDAALYALGSREKYVHLAHPHEASISDHLRQKSWKVITYAENVQKDVDVLFSRLFNIRTAEEIRSTCATEKDYFLSDPKLMEIARRAFWEQVEETMRTSVPQELGIYAVEAMGYTVLGGHLFVWLHGLMFFNNLISKIQNIYLRVEEAEKNEIKKRLFDVLEELYPLEIAQLNAQEEGVEELAVIRAKKEEMLTYLEEEVEEKELQELPAGLKLANLILVGNEE